jgi:DNA mismatch repair protein MutS
VDPAEIAHAFRAAFARRMADGSCQVHGRRLTLAHVGTNSRGPAAGRFHSILFDRPEDRAGVDERNEPPFFADLNLDQVLAPIAGGREEYNLGPFFYTPLRDVASVRYRHEILRDLQKDVVLAAIEEFARRMREMREHLALAVKLHYKYQKERLFLDAVSTYCGAVTALAADLAVLPVQSRGLHSLRGYVAAYTESVAFTALVAETQKLIGDLAAVRYSIHIKGNRVRVDKYGGEPDYSAEVEDTFAKFKQGAVKDYRVGFPAGLDMNHIEAQILDLVARLHPDVFQALDDYRARRDGYLDPTVGAFDREVQFYLAYLEYIAPVKAAGLNFCYPGVSETSKDICVRDAFDLALARKLRHERSTVVCNDFYLNDPERVLVVTGPNQGGKTTFARMFGQLHYLASLGYPVPGSEAQLFLPGQLFTHFEKEEDITTLRGKLEDELTRIHDILRQATSDSIIIMNESFTSTTLSDALFLGREVLQQIIELGPLCVYVTFIDELASLTEATVSMVGTVVRDNPTVRTYKIVRKPADGLAYAAAIAEKYGLTYVRLKERVRR